VTVARITRRKGHLVTLAALSTLSKELRRRITWLVIGPDGEPDYVEEVRRLAATADCDVRFLGSLPDEQVRDIYGAADFFCLSGVPDGSGRVEGFGLVYLEAAATGLPSVATAIGGVPDAVLADETGLLVPPSVGAVARAIAELAEDTDARSLLAAGASAHAGALSWERCAAETYGLSRSVKRSVENISGGLGVGAKASQPDPMPQVHPA
jgi:glycosyltransferase involved in cell wall biosynthesis